MPDCYRCGKKINIVVFCPFCGAKQRSGLEMYKAKDKKIESEKKKAILQITGLADKQTKVLLEGHDLTTHATGKDEKNISGKDGLQATQGMDDPQSTERELPIENKPEVPIHKVKPQGNRIVIGQQVVLWIVFMALFMIFCYVIYIILQDVKSWLG